MKMTQERYNQLLATIRALVTHHGKAYFLPIGQQHGAMAMLWYLYHRAAEQLQYDDSHPFYVAGHWDRIVPHVDGWRSYVDENGQTLNDDHIATALRRIGRELGLTTSPRGVTAAV